MVFLWLLPGFSPPCRLGEPHSKPGQMKVGKGYSPSLWKHGSGITTILIPGFEQVTQVGLSQNGGTPPKWVVFLRGFPFSPRVASRRPPGFPPFPLTQVAMLKKPANRPIYTQLCIAVVASCLLGPGSGRFSRRPKTDPPMPRSCCPRIKKNLLNCWGLRKTW